MTGLGVLTQAPAAVAALDEAVPGQHADTAQHRIEIHARLDRERRGPGRAARGKRVEDPGAIGIEVIAREQTSPDLTTGDRATSGLPWPVPGRRAWPPRSPARASR